MTAAAALATMTARRSLALKRLVGFGLLELAPAFIYLLSAANLRADRALERAVDTTVALYFPLLLPIVALIIGAGALGDERRDGTMSFIVLRPIPRWIIGGAKLAGAGAAAVGLNLLGALALAAAYGVLTGSWDLVGPLAVGSIVATVAYTALFVPLGYLSDRAVLLGLGFVFVFENGVASALQGVASLSPWRLGIVALAGLGGSDVVDALPDVALGDLMPGAWGAVGKVVVLVAASIGAVMLLLRHRDLA